tara:strand:- start:78 stop:404 length:327 start_codon:yes stop_codon:yes gene_type:complete
MKVKFVVELTDYYDEHKDALGQSDGKYLETMGAFKDSYDLSSKIVAFSKKHHYKELKLLRWFSFVDYCDMNDEVERCLEEIEDTWDTMKKMSEEIKGFKAMGFKINYF